MKAIIGFENLKVDCILGVYSYERFEKQTITLDLKVELDVLKCTQTDSLEDAIDYDELAQLCTDFAQSRQFHLIESYASHLMKGIFDKYDVKWVYIKVKKPKAIGKADFAFIEIESRKSP
jgi:7,8-dihydroneopterin aldolase/epimerase/oxygenase